MIEKKARKTHNKRFVKELKQYCKKESSIVFLSLCVNNKGDVDFCIANGVTDITAIKKYLGKAIKKIK